jgi:dCMP deaminase
MKKALALYLPVMHEGYHLFLEKNKSAELLFLFDRQFLSQWSDFEYLKKDIRALDSQLVKQIMENIYPDIEIKLVKTQKDWQVFLDEIKSEDREWVLSNDDFGRYLAEKFLKKEKIVFDSFFLRWDRPAVEQAAQLVVTSEAENKTIADKTISGDEFEKKLMQKAFVQANYSNDWWRQVGVVFVKNGRVLISAYNQHLPSQQEQYFNGDPRTLFSSGEAIELTSSIHAEALAIARAASQGIALAGADLFVTTFPCPICAKQVAASGIKRLYYTFGYSVLDGWQVLKSAGIEIIKVEFSKKEAQDLVDQQAQSSNLKKRYS